MVSRAVSMGLLLLATGCAAEGVRVQAVVRFENHSHFVIEEIRIHDGDLTQGRPLDGTPLPEGGALEATLYERAHVSVIREKAVGGPRIAITTVEPLPIAEGRYILEIFDQAFRLRFSGPLEGAGPDGGTTGGGEPVDGGTSATDGGQG